jgi:probable F420-dependent oxidoreductase
MAGYAVDPIRLARDAEARGFHSLYFPEHTHIPLSTVHPVDGRDFDMAYARTFDPFISLAAAAAVTDRLLLGTGMTIIAQHDPIVLAKEIATLDVISGGRFVLGIGYNWNNAEIVSHGVDPATRRGRVREYMLAMTELWSKEVASYSGKFVSFEPSWAWPKPIQQPRPRTIIGGPARPKTFAHIAEFADGWAPMGGGGMKEALPLLEEEFRKAGRDPAEIYAVPFGTSPSPGKLEYYESLGVEETVLALPSTRDHAETVQVLDGWAAEYPQYLWS